MSATISLVGPSTNPAAPQITPAALDAAVNTALAANALTAFNAVAAEAAARAAGMVAIISTGAAAGLTQAAALVMASSVLVVTTATSATNSVVLNTAFPVANIRNRGAVQIQIWPPFGDTLDGTGAANLPVVIALNSNADFVRITATKTWYY